MNSFNILVFMLIFNFTVWSMPTEPMVNRSMAHSTLTHIVEMVIAVNSSVIPTNLKHLPHHQFLSCLSPEQIAAIDSCKAKVAEEKQKPGQQVSLNFKDNATVGGTNNSQHHTSMPVFDCVVAMSHSVDPVSGKLNMTNLKSHFIGMTLLSTAQKSAANANADSCMASDFLLPLLQSDTRNKTAGGSDKDMMDNNVIAIKILFCVTKALIQNGCARVNQTAALTGKADISTSILVDSAASWMDEDKTDGQLSSSDKKSLLELFKEKFRGSDADDSNSTSSSEEEYTTVRSTTRAPVPIVTMTTTPSKGK